MATVFEDIAQAVVAGNAPKVVTLTRQALDGGTAPVDIFRQGLIPGMSLVGEKMQSGEFYIPEVLISVRAMKAASGLLRPIMAASQAPEPVGRVVMGTVKGDLHDIGKNLVIVMLEGAGFEVTDLGTDVPAERFAAAARQKNAQIVGLSALLTITMVEMKNVIRHLAEAGLRERVKVIIGGAPVTDRFAREAGADGYATNAPLAVEMAKRLVGARQARK